MTGRIRAVSVLIAAGLAAACGSEGLGEVGSGANEPGPFDLQLPKSVADVAEVYLSFRTHDSSAPLEIEIDGNGQSLFRDVFEVQPVTGWTGSGQIVRWTGAIVIAPYSAYDFVVQVEPTAATSVRQSAARPSPR